MVYQLGIKRMINCNSNNNNRKQKTFIRDFLLFIELELAIGKPVNLKIKGYHFKSHWCAWLNLGMQPLYHNGFSVN